jgi:Papain-like cysteine protease AvrRpt2
MNISTRLVVSIAVLMSLSQTTLADEDLGIQPVIQQSPVWCWAAVSEMVLDHYGYSSVNPAGNFQCGVVAMLGGVCSVNCNACQTGIGSTGNLAQVLRQYIALAKQVGADGDSFVPNKTGRLSRQRVISEIDEGDPIIAGISPSGFGQFYPPGFGEHVALIVGYEEYESELHVLVNDPFPYRFFGNDPYLAVGADAVVDGQYLIEYNRFVQRLGYKDSITF